MCTILRKYICLNGVNETYHLTSLTVSPGVTEPYHLTLLDPYHLALLDRITWRYWTVSLALLNNIAWCYWTLSPDVTGQFHLSLLNLLGSFWTVSPCVTETYHQTLQDSDWAVHYAMTNSLICDCFLKWSKSTWQISQWHRKISWSIFSK